MAIVCKSTAEIGKMRAANQLVAQILGDLAAMVAPGVTTADLDRIGPHRRPPASYYAEESKPF